VKIREFYEFFEIRKMRILELWHQRREGWGKSAIF